MKNYPWYAHLAMVVGIILIAYNVCQVIKKYPNVAVVPDEYVITEERSVGDSLYIYMATNKDGFTVALVAADPVYFGRSLIISKYEKGYKEVKKE